MKRKERKKVNTTEADRKWSRRITKYRSNPFFPGETKSQVLKTKRNWYKKNPENFAICKEKLFCSFICEFVLIQFRPWQPA